MNSNACAVFIMMAGLDDDASLSTAQFGIFGYMMHVCPRARQCRCRVCPAWMAE